MRELGVCVILELASSTREMDGRRSDVTVLASAGKVTQISLYHLLSSSYESASGISLSDGVPLNLPDTHWALTDTSPTDSSGLNGTLVSLHSNSYLIEPHWMIRHLLAISELSGCVRVGSMH